MDKIKVSACVVAKNEELFIEKCLKSIVNVVDEIIVLDTGSEDKTIEIAEKYAKVYNYELGDDFSKARNESMSYANGEWIFIIDADEELTESSQINLKIFFGDLDKYGDVIYNAKIVNPHPDETKPLEIFYRQTLFKNIPEIKFVKKKHEHLEYPETIKTMNMDFVEIINNKNYRPQEVITKKLEHSLKALLKCIDESPTNSDKAHYIKHLIWDYEEFEMFDKELDACYVLYDLYKKINFPKPSDDYFHLIFRMIKKELTYKKDFKKSIELCNEGLEFYPNYFEFLFYKALALKNLGKTKESIEEIKKCLKNVNTTHPLYSSYIDRIFSEILEYETFDK